MLIANGQSYWFIALIVVLAIAAVVALITRENSIVESSKPLSLSDEERLILQAIALESRKQGRQKGKKSKRTARDDAREEATVSSRDDI